MKKYVNMRSGFLTTLLALIFAILSGFVQQYMLAADEQSRFEQYGEWQMAAYNVDENVSDALKAHASIERTGTMTAFGAVLDRSGQTVGVLGYVDDDAVALGHISLSEGRLPETANEIALEQSTLVALGYSFDLGQEIRFTTRAYASKDVEMEHPILITRTYTLVGLLKSYSVVWDSAYDGPVSAIVSDELPSDTLLKGEILFMLGSYSNLSDANELNELLGWNSTMVYNFSAYPYATLESDLPWLLAIMLSVVLLLCGVFSWLHGETERISIYRDLGADARTIRGMMTGIFKTALLRGSVLALGVSMLCLAALMLVHRLISAIPVPLTWELIGFGALRSLAAWVLCALFALAFCSTKVKQLCEMRSRTGVTVSRKSRKPRALTTRAVMRIHQRSNRKVYITKVLTGILYCAVSFALVFFAANRYVEAGWMEFGLPADYTLGNTDVRTGLDEESITQLERTEGIESVQYLSECQAVELTEVTKTHYAVIQHKLYWDGIEDSAYAEQHFDEYTSFPLLGVTDEMLDYFISLSDTNAETRQLLDEGGAILYMYDYDYDSVQLGDDISLTTEYGVYEGKVAGICTVAGSFFDDYMRTIADFLSVSECYLIVEKSTLDEFLGFTAPYNDVHVFTDGSVPRDVTDKLISRVVSTSGGMGFSNYLEQIEQSWNGCYSFIMIAAFIFAAMSVLFAFVMFYSNSSKHGGERRYMSLLRDIGMTRRRAEGLAIRGDLVRGVVFALVGAGACLLAKMVQVIIDYLDPIAEFGISVMFVKEEGVATIWESTFQFYPFWMLLVVLVVTALLPGFAAWCQVRSDKIL